jgi:catechol 2,3-dioxygenase-like lactoylglutathione lyase family enzyme
VELEVTGLDHLYLSVSDFARAETFYDRVMAILGFRKGTKAIGGDRHAHYFNRVMQISIRPARSTDRPHDAYAPGLHHVCLRLPDRRSVDAATRALRALGIEATAPRLYPEYADDYYATFFSDPDGLRLELVANRRLRDLVRERWDDLVDFVDPVQKLLEREKKS